MTALEPREAYRLWAPSYSAETVISFLDEELATALTPALDGKRLLDAGCGTGRRLGRSEAVLATGVDLSLDMLLAGTAERVAAADIRALPFSEQSFDVVWCRLVLGHIADTLPAWRELARVSRIGGLLLISDFHADAVAAGHRRTFRDQRGKLQEVEHHIHEPDVQIHVAARFGLGLRARRDGRVGPGVRNFYLNAGREAHYERDRGLALVNAFLFQRTA